MTKKVILPFLAIIAILTSWSQLHLSAQTPEERFNAYDTNQDGILSGDEMNAAEILRRLDLNNDGTLTKSEAVRALQQFRKNRPANPTPALNPTFTQDTTLKEQPQLLKPADHQIGHLITHPALQSLTQKKNSVLLILFSATCPISNKLGPEIARIEADYSDKPFTIRLVNTVPTDTQEDLTQFIKAHNLRSPIVNDPDQSLLQQLRATTTTETFVIDPANTLVYRGAINDQYGLGYTKADPRNHYLRNALDSVLNHQPPQIAATTAPGCALDLPANAPSNTTITYHNQIARLMQSHCIECHRKDGLGPFPLETMADLIDNAGMIRKQVDRGAMPPWFAHHPTGETSTPTLWANDRALPEADKATLLQWLASDRPAGDPDLAPVPRQFASTWNIGQPDTILQIPKPFQIKAEGVMAYQTAIVTTDFPTDRWVSAYEIQPTAPSVVHHVIVRVHPKGTKVTDHREGADGFWAAYVPGNASRILPDGFAKKLPAGAILSFQIHYTPNGKATEDQIKIGLKFATKPPQNEIHIAAVAQPRLNIPPGAPRHVVTKQQPAPFDMMLTGYMPHMHVRGVAFKYDITYPDQQKETLLDIPHYDFNWQLQYTYKQPKFIPKGSVMTITAAFDNSTNNPANPDPTQTVRWGSQTYDEMMIGYIEHYVPLQK
ncbi:redoxin domain-containing protein [Phragmitibacter flavus]|uniref:Redoxin domain-containing protein n=1 Tax=Phragmitibacter flavus TaxID=2576071 RepID=A0A5R8KE55_9BACT|nr:redoxin domain-containing protein [Phragmitibacter flavus]TLD70596.1 redoxin domain-containing protein [Phragmitibacter flavus]